MTVAWLLARQGFPVRLRRSTGPHAGAGSGAAGAGEVIRISPTAGTGTPTRDYGIGATDL